MQLKTKQYENLTFSIKSKAYPFSTYMDKIHYYIGYDLIYTNKFTDFTGCFHRERLYFFFLSACPLGSP